MFSVGKIDSQFMQLVLFRQPAGVARFSITSKRLQKLPVILSKVSCVMIKHAYVDNRNPSLGLAGRNPLVSGLVSGL